MQSPHTLRARSFFMYQQRHCQRRCREGHPKRSQAQRRRITIERPRPHRYSPTAANNPHPHPRAWVCSCPHRCHHPMRPLRSVVQEERPRQFPRGRPCAPGRSTVLHVKSHRRLRRSDKVARNTTKATSRRSVPKASCGTTSASRLRTSLAPWTTPAAPSAPQSTAGSEAKHLRLPRVGRHCRALRRRARQDQRISTRGNLLQDQRHRYPKPPQVLHHALPGHVPPLQRRLG